MKTFRTLADLLITFPSRGQNPVVLALNEEGIQTHTYAELESDSTLLAQGLLESGLKTGDHAALMAGASYPTIVAALAMMRMGAVIVPIDTQFADDALRHVFEDSSAKKVFTDAEGAERLKQLNLAKGPEWIRLDGDENAPESWHRHFSDKKTAFYTPAEDTPAALFYTSGTTGMPKGVPLSHRNLAFQIESIIAADFVHDTDRLLLPLPLHHVYPFIIGTLCPLALGLPIIIPASLTGPQVIRAIREGRATIVAGVPRLYRAMFDGIKGKVDALKGFPKILMGNMMKLSQWLRRRMGIRAGKKLLAPLHKQLGPELRVLASGGSPLDSDLAYSLEGMGWQIGIGYGLTETSPLLTLNVPGKTKLASVGQAVPGVELRLGDIQRDEEEVGAAEGRKMGEVQARGPNVFKGYRNLPEETRKAFTDDGWFRTGDLGWFDDDGYLYLGGRASTMIVTDGGENIQPDDVEEQYSKHPLIREIGIFQKNKALVGLIVPELTEIRKTRVTDVDAVIRDAVKEQSKKLPSYQRISEYVITRETIARTRLGKIRRHLLKEHYERARKGEDNAATEKHVGLMPIEDMNEDDAALLRNPAALIVWNWLGEKYAEQRIAPDTSPQFDLGVDSLEWLNITLEIGQRAGVELSEEAIGRVDTVRQLLYEVAAVKGGTVVGADPLDDPEGSLTEDMKKWLEPKNALFIFLGVLLYGITFALLRLTFRLTVTGKEKLDPNRSYVFAPNHTSYLDAPVLGAGLSYGRLRKSYWAAWTGIAFANPIARFVSRVAQVVPIDADRAAVSSLAFGATAIKRGHNLVWFPEGGRSPDGTLKRLKPGLGMALSRFPSAVVPVLIEGAYEAWPTGQSMFRPSKIRITIGDPVESAQLLEEGEGAKPHDRIMSGLRKRLIAMGAKAEPLP